MRLGELAERLGCRLEGDGDVQVLHVSGIEAAGPGDLTFLSNPRYAAALPDTRASAVILHENVGGAPCAVLRSANPYLAFARAISLLSPVPRPVPGIHPLTAIGDGVEMGPEVSIGPFVTIADGARIGARVVLGAKVTIGPGVVIGDDCLLHAGASIREHTVLGQRVIVQDGAVVGSDGFGFARREDGSYEKIPQPGAVVIEDDVEIGANTTIDRPAVGETRVRAGAKLDNLVQIGHGVTVGRDTLLCAQVGVAGSSSIGDKVVLAGQVGVAGHLEVGDRVTATAQTGIPNSVEAGTVVSGYPAIPNRDWLKASAVFRRLPELKKALAELRSRLDEIDKQIDGQKTF